MSWFLSILLAAMWPTLADQVGAENPPAKQSDEAEAGAFERLRRVRLFIRPGILSAAAGQTGTDTDRVPPPTLPGDFEQRPGLLLAAERMASDYPGMLAQLVAEIQPRVAVIGLVSSPPGREKVLQVLAARGLCAEAIRLIEVPADTVWVRDFGPIFASRAHGAWAALDFDYLRKSGARRRQQDDAAAQRIAGHCRVPATHIPLALEGGNLLSNGRGLLLTTTVTFNANILRGREQAFITRTLCESLGLRQIVVLQPLRGELTGHVDMFACWTDPETVVLGAYAKSDDPINAAILDENAAILAQVRGESGKPLRVRRIPMPSSQNGAWRTYTNCIFANRSLLVPRYRGVDRTSEERAMQVFRQLLPGWQIIRIDSDALIAREGALRCIVLPVPVIP